VLAPVPPCTYPSCPSLPHPSPLQVGIHKHDIDAAIETYTYMSSRLFTHATPTLFNSGTPRPQMSSCFLLAMKDDR